MAQSMEDTSYRLVKSEVCDLTPELAQQFRDLDPSPTERELNPARIRHLKTKAEAGQLVTFHWSVAKLGDKRLPERTTQLKHAVRSQWALPEGAQGSPRRIRGAEQAFTRPAVPAVRRPQVQSISERRGECISGPLHAKVDTPFDRQHVIFYMDLDLILGDARHLDLEGEAPASTARRLRRRAGSLPRSTARPCRMASSSTCTVSSSPTTASGCGAAGHERREPPRAALSLALRWVEELCRRAAQRDRRDPGRG